LSLLKAGIGPPLTEAMRTLEGCRILKDDFFGKEITAQSVMENLELIPPHQFVEAHAQMVEWLKAWINEASIDQLEEFLHCVTGHKSLNMGKIIIRQNVRNGESSAAVEIHTCSNSIDLPRVDADKITQEIFIHLLQNALQENGYNVG
jgi:hypothetical protein